MVLSGWKEIANHLQLGVRTVQRWESKGLPVNRPFPGGRSHVIAYSEQLDKWVQRARLERTASPNVFINIAEARRLTAEAQAARSTLHRKMQALKNEMATLRVHRRRYV
jgi:phage terminase Nu1 subunit (DNA packaging protein)